ASRNDSPSWLLLADQRHRFLAIAEDDDARRMTRRNRLERLRHLRDRRDRHVIDLNDDVAGTDPGALRGAALVHVAHHHAARAGPSVTSLINAPFVPLRPRSSASSRVIVSVETLTPIRPRTTLPFSSDGRMSRTALIGMANPMPRLPPDWSLTIWVLMPTTSP